jgi:uncharacterized spore protein YtfJ
MSLSDVIKTALSEMQAIANTETVIGEPIRAGEVTLIPVSRVSIGFAAGGAGKEASSASGAGTGGGITVTPVAFIEVSNGRVQVHQVSPDDACFNKILSLAPEAIKKISSFFSRDDDTKSKGKKTDEFGD